jgi:hypothetical protein
MKDSLGRKFASFIARQQLLATFSHSLGHKPTFTAQEAKSALPLTADFDPAELDVGSGPIVLKKSAVATHGIH